MTARKQQKKPATLPMPDVWKEDFRSYTMRSNFVLSMTQAMIQLLSALADGVMWDRYLYCSIHAPDNWIATGDALIKRGLIRRVVRERSVEVIRDTPHGEYAPWELTPAGTALVELLKVTGMFVEADAAINKKSRKA